MKKNKMMRLGSTLLVATLASTCVLGGTFAKYVTETSGTDSARVAKWGFNQDAKINIDNLFADAYATSGNKVDYPENTGNTATVRSVAKATKVIAPGTKGEAKFAFSYGGDAAAAAPEVAYTFTIDTTGSACGTNIKANPDIVWSLDGTACTGWDDLITQIKDLSGSTNGSGTKNYDPNTLPDAFKDTGANEHTVSWEWKYEDTDKTAAQDKTDTDLGNAGTLETVNLSIKITATQID